MTGEPSDPSWEGRERVRVALLLTVAVVLRVAYFFDYTNLPFLDGPLYDSLAYLRQVKAISEGHFGDATLLAFSPLYGYFLYATFVMQSLHAPILVQLAMGIGNTWLVYGTTRVRGSAGAASLSALLFVGYGLTLSYETKLMSETLGLTLALSSFWIALRPTRHPGASALLSGFLLGLGVLARASMLFTAPCFVLAGACRFWPQESRRVALRRAAMLALGVGVVLTANGFRNQYYSGHFVPVTFVPQSLAIAATTDVHGNLSAFSRDGSGDVSPFDVVKQAEEQLRAGRQTTKPLSTRIAEYDFRGFLMHAPGKLWRGFSDLELTFYQYGYYGERSEIPTLGWLPVSFGILLLLGLLGAVPLVRTYGLEALAPYAAFVVGPCITTALFHPDSRYRLPMIIPLLALSGLGLIWLGQRPWTRTRLALALVVAVACGVLASRTLRYELVQPAIWQLTVAESAASLGDTATVEARVARARESSQGDPVIERRIRYTLNQLADARARRHLAP